MGQEPFGDIPLFREIQRILASSEGPINFEIARQVATAIGTEGASTTAPPPDAARSLSEAARAAELLVSGYTRLALVEPVTARLETRSWWVGASLQSWRWLLERLAERFGGEIGQLQGQPEGSREGLGLVLGQLGPLLMGMQVGTLVGHLAREVVATYDVPIPREGERHLFVVWENAKQVSSEYDLELDSLLAWLARQSVSRHLLSMQVPWLARYHRSLLIEVVDSLEIDVSDLERRMVELQSKGVEAMQEGMKPEELIPVAHTERHSAALDRLRSFLALFDGYASHASSAVSDKLIGDSARIDEGIARRKRAGGQGETMLGSVLGLRLDRELQAAGATFCAAVERLKGLPALNRVWDAPDNLPGLGEIKDPFAWIERVVDEGPRAGL